MVTNMHSSLMPYFTPPESMRICIICYLRLDFLDLTLQFGIC